MSRSARSCALIVCLSASFFLAAPNASAQDIVPRVDSTSVVQAFTPADLAVRPADLAVTPEEPAQRPAALVPMYVSFAALQALDIHSTMIASSRGGQEVNPIVRSAVDSPAALIAMKAGTSIGLVFVSERFAKRHPRGAVILMTVMNSVYAAIVARNYSIARQ